MISHIFFTQHSSEQRNPDHNPDPFVMQKDPLPGFWYTACSDGVAKHCTGFKDENYPQVKYGVTADLL
jgi:hypothetical protein